MPTRLRIKAHAKVNLGLRVLGRRPDGYHELRTIMQTIALSDELTLEIIPDSASSIANVDITDRSAGEGAGSKTASKTAGEATPREPQIELAVEPPLTVPPQENLVYRAAQLLLRTSAIKHNFNLRIRLLKEIPLGAGLGGGSSDAAATLAGLNKLLGLNLDKERLAALGAQLGSDVPFFIHGGTCFVEGRGEKIKRLPPLPRYSLLLILPPLALATAEVYRKFDELKGWGDQGNGEDELEKGPRPSGYLHNDLEAAAVRLCPELARYRRFLRELEPRPAFWGLSGSGPTWFAGFSTKHQAEEALQAARKRLPQGTQLILTDLTDHGYEFL